MKKLKDKIHVFSADYEDKKENDLTPCLAEKDILLDIKFLMREYYIATFTNNSKSLKVHFNNGQAFLINVKDITKEEGKN